MFMGNLLSSFFDESGKSGVHRYNVLCFKLYINFITPAHEFQFQGKHLASCLKFGTGFRKTAKFTAQLGMNFILYNEHCFPSF